MVETTRDFCEISSFVGLSFQMAEIRKGNRECGEEKDILVELLSTQKQFDCSECDTSTLVHICYDMF